MFKKILTLVFLFVVVSIVGQTNSSQDRKISVDTTYSFGVDRKVVMNIATSQIETKVLFSVPSELVFDATTIRYLIAKKEIERVVGTTGSFKKGAIILMKIFWLEDGVVKNRIVESTESALRFKVIACFLLFLFYVTLTIFFTNRKIKKEEQSNLLIYLVLALVFIVVALFARVFFGFYFWINQTTFYSLAYYLLFISLYTVIFRRKVSA